MTEEEARKKTCPDIQILGVVCASVPLAVTKITSETLTNVPANIKCIASDCMAWGWHKVLVEAINDPDRPMAPKSYKYEMSTKRGYCRHISEQLTITE